MNDQDNKNVLGPAYINQIFSSLNLNDYFPGIIYVYDVKDNRLNYLNKKVTDILGYSMEDIQSWDQDLMKMVFAEDVDLVRQELSKYFELEKDNNTYSFNCRFNHKEKNYRHFKTQGSVIRRDQEGKPTTLFFIAQDITDELLSDHELKKLKELMHDTELFLEYGTWTWDLLTGKIEISDGIYKLLENNKETILREKGGKVDNDDFDYFFAYVHPEDKKTLQKHVEKIIQDKKDIEFQFRIKSMPGDEKILQTITKAISDENDNTIKLIGVTRDITKFSHYQREIEKSVADLNRSNKELEEFAYIASHDLQEPLRKIITFSERLSAKFEIPLGLEGKTYLDRMKVATENMQILIDNLLEFSRVTRKSDAFEKTSLMQIWDEAKAELELKIEATSARFTENKLPAITCNRSQMKQLFVNLLSNALKFKKQTINPIIEITSSEVSAGEKATEHLSPEQVYYKISVSDNGIGFEPQYAERIFQIFQRLHGKSEYPGSGIGLAICKKIVDQHNGSINASSEFEKGSTFHIYLPSEHSNL